MPTARGTYKLEGDTKQAQDANAELQRTFEDLQKVALIATAAVAGVAAGITKIITSTADYNVTLLRTSQILGTTTEYISAQAYALRQSGIELDDFTDAAVTMAERMKEAEQETGTLFEFAPQLGLDLEELGRLTPIGALEAFGEALRNTRDPTLRMAAASEVLGDVGFRLIPFFEQGTQTIAMFREEAVRAGVVVSEEQARTAEAFQRSWGRVQALLQGVALEIGNALLPIVNDYLVKFSDWFNENRATITTTLGQVLAIFLNLAEAAPRAFNWIVDNKDAIIGAITALAGAWATYRGIVITTAIAQLAAAHPVLAAGIGVAAFGGAAGVLIGSLVPGAGTVGDAFNRAGGNLAALFEGLGGAVSGGVGDAFSEFLGGGDSGFIPGVTAGPDPNQRVIRPPAPTTVNVNISPGGDLVTETEGGLRGEVERGVRQAIGAGYLQSGIIPAGCVAVAVNR